VVPGSELHEIVRAFVERAERERRWSTTEDIPWSATSPAAASPGPSLGEGEALALVAETFFALEAVSPDFARLSLSAMRDAPALRVFVAHWGSDKTKRLIALRRWLERRGRSSERLDEIERAASRSLEEARFEGSSDASTTRRLLFVGCLQAMVSFVTYARHREVARKHEDAALRTLYDFSARDDLAHGRLMQQALALHLEADRAATLEDMTGVLSELTLPGTSPSSIGRHTNPVFPDWDTRMQAIRGPGLDVHTFIQRVYVPVLRNLGISRHDLTRRAAGADSSRLPAPPVDAGLRAFDAPLAERSTRARAPGAALTTLSRTGASE
jgi:acyl-[acyl-carrier-protein] desaturase